MNSNDIEIVDGTNREEIDELEVICEKEKC